jgi:hypothetical protein
MFPKSNAVDRNRLCSNRGQGDEGGGERKRVIQELKRIGYRKKERRKNEKKAIRNMVAGIGGFHGVIPDAGQSRNERGACPGAGEIRRIGSQGGTLHTSRDTH